MKASQLFCRRKSTKNFKKKVQTSFVDLLEISNFAKFRGCGSKIEPTMPISILNFEWAWQAQFLSYTHKTLENYSSFLDEQMILLLFLNISNQK